MQWVEALLYPRHISYQFSLVTADEPIVFGWFTPWTPLAPSSMPHQVQACLSYLQADVHWWGLGMKTSQGYLMQCGCICLGFLLCICRCSWCWYSSCLSRWFSSLYYCWFVTSSPPIRCLTVRSIPPLSRLNEPILAWMIPYVFALSPPFSFPES